MTVPARPRLTSNSQLTLWSHINGTQSELLDRLAVSELCKAWSVRWDMAEWANFRDLFAPQGAWVWTSTYVPCIITRQKKGVVISCEVLAQTRLELGLAS